MKKAADVEHELAEGREGGGREGGRGGGGSGT